MATANPIGPPAGAKFLAEKSFLATIDVSAFAGKYLLVSGSAFAGAYEKFDDAYAAGINQFGENNFMLRRIDENPQQQPERVSVCDAQMLTSRAVQLDDLSPDEIEQMLRIEFLDPIA